MEDTSGKPRRPYDYLVSLADKLEAEHIQPDKVDAILITPIAPPQPHKTDPKHNYIHRAFVVYGTSVNSREFKHIDSCVWEA
jgi:hypothetical protein